MRSSLISLSLCLSSISLAGCSDGADCGTGDAPATGLVAENADVSLTFGNLSSLSGNDCPASDAPEGVISLSIEGDQTAGGTGLITFCIPRPDLLAKGRALGTTGSMGEIRVIDLSGMASGCAFALDSAVPPTGTATGSGVCKNGTDPAGFALAITGTASLRRTCGAAVDTVSVTLAGTVAVTSRD